MTKGDVKTSRLIVDALNNHAQLVEALEAVAERIPYIVSYGKDNAEKNTNALQMVVDALEAAKGESE